MVNVTYISPYFWPEEIGSAPYCTRLAEYLTEHGYVVEARAFRPHYPDPSVFTAWADGSRDEETHGGIRIRRTAVVPRGSGGLKERLRNDLRLLFDLTKEALIGPRSKSDVIIAYVPSIIAVYGAILLKWRHHAPLMLIVHDIESGLAGNVGIAKNGSLLRIMRYVERVALNRAETISVLTEGMRGELVAIGCKRPIDVLPIWTDPFPPSPFPSFEHPVVSYSGNLGKKQNLDQLVQPIALLNERRPEVKVVMRGDGSEKERIRKLLLDELKLPNTRFEPLVPSDQFAAFLQAAHVHLVPQALNVADYALPSKIVSIMAAGRPFICIAEPGSPLDRLVTETDAGLRVEPENDEALFAAIDLLTRDVDLAVRLGNNGRRFVAENLSTSHILSKFVEKIHRLNKATPE